LQSDPEGKKKLEDSQRAFLVYRQSHADFVDSMWRGGNGRDGAREGAMKTLTEERIGELRWLTSH
jgi:uncharacterized protein YecT (DUF1311 family)